MGSGEEERGGASEAAFTDSADGSSSSSDAASTDDWPALALAAPKKTPACGGAPDAEMSGKQKRRAGPGTRASHSSVRGEASQQQCRYWC